MENGKWKMENGKSLLFLVFTHSAPVQLRIVSITSQQKVIPCPYLPRLRMAANLCLPLPYLP